jgi:hypothetical protein
VRLNTIKLLKTNKQKTTGRHLHDIEHDTELSNCFLDTSKAQAVSAKKKGQIG